MMKSANKSFSLVQPMLVKQQFFKSTIFPESSSGQTQMIGLISTLFLCVYACGQFFVGTLADQIDLRYFLTIAMIFAGILTILFSTAGYLEYHDVWVYCVIWSFNGIAQACGWPSNLTIMNNWFGKKSRGLIFSAWSSNANLGNILGAIICAVVFAVYPKDNTVWQLCMLVCGLGAIIGSLLIYLFLVPKSYLHDQLDEISNEIQTNTDNIEKNLPKNSIRPNTLTKYTSIVFSYNKSSRQFDTESNKNNNHDKNDNKNIRNDQLVIHEDEHTEQECHLGNNNNDGDDNDNDIENHNHHDHDDDDNKGIELQISNSNHGNNNLPYKPLKQSSEENLPATSTQLSLSSSLPPPPSYFKTLVMGLNTRGVIPYMIIYACVKGVVYVFMYWVPLFLTSSKSMSNSNAAIISALFDIGGFVGGVCSGYLTDILGSRTLVIILMTSISLGLIWLLFHSVISQIYAISACLLLLGVCIGGVQVLISGSVALDLGDIASKKNDDDTNKITEDDTTNDTSDQNKRKEEQQQQQSQQQSVQLTGTISGLVEGSGSAGAALLQYLVGELLTCQQETNADGSEDNVVCEWHLILYVITAAVLLSLFCLLYIKFLNKLL